MAADFEIRGAEDIDALVKRIASHADAKAIRREMYQGLNRESKDVRDAMKKAIPDALPRRGGLADLVQAGTRMTATAKSGKSAGVTIWAKSGKHDIRMLRNGRLRHPVFGHRSTWVTQTAGLDPEAFLGSFEKQAPEVKRAILRVLEDIARKVAG